MATDWEQTFRRWGQPPSQTEREKCENAERAVRKAIEASSTLRSCKLRVFAQGSYANRTNVGLESDVDVCVCSQDVCFLDFEDGLTKEACGIGPAPYEYTEFKNAVGATLSAHFGSGTVHRGKKAFDIHANSYRLDADVVACFQHFRYYRGSDSLIHSLEGTEFRPDSGGRVINWPQQHYDRGVAKNQVTGERFKAVTRVLKNLRGAMDGYGIAIAKDFPSFLIECLVYNAPNTDFGHQEYVRDVREVLLSVINLTKELTTANQALEVNERKYLFHPSQAWTREQANAFVSAAWGCVGFK